MPAGAAGLFGHSEGGWVVLRAPSARGDVPWVVTSGCPGVTPAAQERYALAIHLQSKLAGRAQGPAGQRLVRAAAGPGSGVWRPARALVPGQ